MDSTTYPERPAHFDRTFLRALVERHAANTIGTFTQYRAARDRLPG